MLRGPDEKKDEKKDDAGGDGVQWRSLTGCAKHDGPPHSVMAGTSNPCRAPAATICSVLPGAIDSTAATAPQQMTVTTISGHTAGTEDQLYFTQAATCAAGAATRAASTTQTASVAMANGGGLKSAAVDWSKAAAGVFQACYLPKGGAAWQDTGLTVIVTGNDVNMPRADFPCMSSSRVAFFSATAKPSTTKLCGSKAVPCNTFVVRACLINVCRQADAHSMPVPSLLHGLAMKTTVHAAPFRTRLR